MKMETLGVVSQACGMMITSGEADDAENECITCRIWFYMAFFFL